MIYTSPVVSLLSSLNTGVDSDLHLQAFEPLNAIVRCNHPPLLPFSATQAYLNYTGASPATNQPTPIRPKGAGGTTWLVWAIRPLFLVSETLSQ